jgi:hypothetical protein
VCRKCEDMMTRHCSRLPESDVERECCFLKVDMWQGKNIIPGDSRHNGA